MKDLIVIPGASSPFSESNIPEHDFLRREGEKRNVKVRFLDFVGCGHHSIHRCKDDFGNGLSIHAATEKVLTSLEGAQPDSLLFCRCTGCDVAAQVMAESPKALAKFRRIIFWAAISGQVYWRIIPDIKDKLDSFNLLWEQKGWTVDSEFWATYTPIDAQLLRCKWEGELILAAGTFDDRTTPEFQRYLAALVNRHTKCRARAVEIPDAQHRVTEEDISPRGRRAYLDLLFSP